MSCIPLNGLQRNRLMAHLFLSSMNAGDPVECSGFEKLISNWIKPLLDAVSEFFFKIKLGSTIIPDYIVEEILNKNVKFIKTDIAKFAEYALIVSKTYSGLNRDERGWSWTEGFHWFLNHNFVHNNKYLHKTSNGTGYTVNDLDYMLENYKFHVYQLNFIGWVRSYMKIHGETTMKFSNPKDHLKATITGHCPKILQQQQGWNQTDVWKYVNGYILPAAMWIADLNMQDLKPKNVVVDEKKEPILDIKNLNLKTVGALAAGFMIFGKLK